MHGILSLWGPGKRQAVLIHPLTASLCLGCEEVQGRFGTMIFPDNILSIISISSILTILFCFGRTVGNLLSQKSFHMYQERFKQAKENLKHPFSLHPEIPTINMFVTILLDSLVFLSLKKKKN